MASASQSASRYEGGQEILSFKQQQPSSAPSRYESGQEQSSAVKHTTTFKKRTRQNHPGFCKCLRIEIPEYVHSTAEDVAGDALWDDLDLSCLDASAAATEMGGWLDTYGIGWSPHIHSAGNSEDVTVNCFEDVEAEPQTNSWLIQPADNLEPGGLWDVLVGEVCTSSNNYFEH